MRANRIAVRLLLIVVVAFLLATAFAGWKWQKSAATQAGWTSDQTESAEVASVA